MTHEQPQDAGRQVDAVETAGLAAVLIDAADADDRADTLRHAGSLLWHLSDDPAAEQLNEQLSEGTAPTLADLGADLLAMADLLAEHDT